MNKKDLTKILYYFIIYGLIVVASHSVLSTILFFSGNGVKFLGSLALLPHAEILNVMIVVSSICLSLYLISHNKIFLFLFIVIHVTVFFSDRRTPTIILFIIDIILFYYYRKFGKKLILRFSLIIVISVGILFLIKSISLIDLNYYYFRLYTVLGGEVNISNPLFSDMGHWEQTQLTFSKLLKNLNIFWGSGLRNPTFYVSGQSTYIHNSFVVVWALYGLPMTIFMLYILVLFVGKTLIFLKRSSKSFYNPITAPIVFAYMMIQIGEAFTGEYFGKHFVYMSLFVLILSFLRLDQNDEKIIFYQLIRKKSTR